MKEAFEKPAKQPENHSEKAWQDAAADSYTKHVVAPAATPPDSSITKHGFPQAVIDEHGISMSPTHVESDKQKAMVDPEVAQGLGKKSRMVSISAGQCNTTAVKRNEEWSCEALAVESVSGSIPCHDVAGPGSG